MFKPLSNRRKDGAGLVVYELPADGFVQVVPKGRAPNVLEDGTPIMQVVDDAALQAMFNRAAASNIEALVDDEHFAHDEDKGTNAMAWAPFNKDDLQLRDDGLYCRLHFTPPGLTLVTTGEKKFISPEFPPPTPETLNRLIEEISPGVYRPLAVTGFGLTNKPAFRRYAKPLANREPNTNHDHTTMLKPLVAALFGLTETALDALDEAALKNRFTEFSGIAKRAADAETELKTLKNREADEFMTTHDAVIPKDEALRKHVREQFLCNRELATGLVAGFKAAKEKEDPNAARKARADKPLFNREAKTPAEEGDGASAEEERLAKVIKNRARELVAASGGKRRYSECFTQASAEHEAEGK